MDLSPIDSEGDWKIYLDDILKEGKFIAEYKKSGDTLQ